MTFIDCFYTYTAAAAQFVVCADARSARLTKTLTRINKRNMRWKRKEKQKSERGGKETDKEVLPPLYESAKK